ncbi:conserved protein of unknown function [Tenacibaculum sp. 190524A02b]|uniref:hypothetical protein n=1 Tax=Tenacibaculum vairaonense TaxID=3137860 RepID=UPI0032B18637
MKVKLKFSVDHVLAINDLLNQVYELPFNFFNEQEKVAISIAALLSDKFEAKKRELKKNLNLLNRNKKIQFTLKYHEAWALKNICINQISLVNIDINKIRVQEVIGLLDVEK